MTATAPGIGTTVMRVRPTWPRPARLKVRLALILALVLVPPLLYSAYQAWAAYRAQQLQQMEQAAGLLDIVVAYQRDFIVKTRLLLDRLALQEKLWPPDADCNERLRRASAQSVEYGNFVLTDGRGIGLCSSSPALIGTDFSDRAYFAALRNGRDFVVSGRLVGRDGRGETIVVTRAIRDTATGELLGSLGVSLDLVAFTRAMRVIELPRDVVVYVLDRNGELLDAGLASSPEQLLSAPAEAELAQLLEWPRQMLRLAGRDGRERLYMAAPVMDALFTVVALPAPSRFAWLHRRLVLGILVPIVMLSIAVFAIWLAIDFLVVRHVRALAEAAGAYGRGELGARVDLAGAPEELEQLAHVFNSMAARIERREKELRASLEQKDLLLREIHHRIKNNLQIVTSLLNLRARGLTSREARQTMTEAQLRIRALALVHRHLYQHESVQRVRLDSFLVELLELLRSLATNDAREVTLDVAIAPLEIDGDQAIPLALFLTEAVMNAFRHAFADNGGLWRIGIRLEVDRRTATLRVVDNGRGFDPDAVEAGAGIGLRLMRMLAAQLGGSCSFPVGAGGEVRLTFPIHDEAQKKSVAEGTGSPAAG